MSNNWTKVERRVAQLLALIVSFAAPICHAADTAPASLARKLVSLAGADSKDCGSIALGGDEKTAIACAKDSAAAAIAFRVALQMQGIDSIVWQGAARDEHGRIWVLFYDADPSGGSGSTPTLSAVPCHRYVFSRDGKDVLECDPSVGEH